MHVINHELSHIMQKAIVLDNYINNELIKSTEDIIYIDTNSYIKDSKYLENPYSYYPNTKGYQQISSKILSKIGKKLEKT